MAEETIQNEQVDGEPQGAAKPETDWKAEARKWEALAKKGRAAEERLAQLEEERMTEQEKANARAEKAEAELQAIKAEQARLESARLVSESAGVPRELLEFCSCEEDMKDFATVYKTYQPEVHAVSRDASARIVPDKTKLTSDELFADTVSKMFK